MKDHRVQYELTAYQGKDVIFIRFEYDRTLIERVKKLVGVRWNPSEKAWYVLDTIFFVRNSGFLQSLWLVNPLCCSFNH